MKYSIVLYLLLFQMNIYSQNILNIDLAGPPNQSIEIPAGDYKLVLVNVLPKFWNQYEIIVRTIQSIPSPIDINNNIEGDESGINNCKITQSNVANEINKYSGEQEFVLNKDKVLSNLASSHSSCSTKLISNIIDRLTTFDQNITFKLEKGENLEIKITRKENGTIQKVWNFTYTTKSRGEWSVLFGLNYSHLKASWRAPQFLSIATDTTNTQFILEEIENKNTRNNFVPSLMFYWIPRTKKQKSLMYAGISGGIGYGTNNFEGFISPISFSYETNISFALGASFIQDFTLKDGLFSGQIAPESKSFNDLHDKSWRVFPYISLAFRLSSNPFKTESPSP